MIRTVSTSLTRSQSLRPREWSKIIIRGLSDGVGAQRRSTATAISESQARQGVDASFPVLLRNFWPAQEIVQSGDFEVQAFCDHIAYERNYVTSKRCFDKRFMYTDASGARFLLPDSSPWPDAPTDLVDITPAELAASIQHSGEAEPFTYFTSPLADVAPRLADKHDAVVESMQIRAPSSSSRVRGGLNVWLGSKGCVTQAHYDTDDNVFVQAAGTKLMRLFAPSRAPSLLLFPDAHPRARKSQLDLDAPSAPSPDLTVSLRPGDCLFLPAFWFHHVEAVTASVSLNVFSEAPAWTSAEALLDLPTPADRLAGPMAEEAVVQFALYALPSLGIPDVPAFVAHHILDTRYRSVIVPESDAPPPGPSRAPPRAPSAEESLRFDPMAAALREGFACLERAGGGPAKELVLSHLLELWAVRAGGPGSVRRILKRCVDTQAGNRAALGRQLEH